MPFTVQLDLDADTEATLGCLAGRLDAISGLETVRRIGDVHHISLGVYAELPLELFVPKVASFAEALKPIDVRLANIGIFPAAESVLFVGPVVTAELLELHRRFHEEFASFAHSCWDHYRPGAWVPHVSLALNVTPAALNPALTECLESWKPASAKLDAVRLIEFRPIRMVYRRQL